MSSDQDHSTSSSSSVGNASAKGNNKQEEFGRPLYEAFEADPSIVSRSFSLPRGNHSASAERVAWRRRPSNEVIRPPNRNIGRLNNNRAPNVMAPHMDFRQPNLHAYGTVPPPVFPVQPFINGYPDPSTSSSAQGLNVFFPYASYCTPYNYYPTHPHAGYFIPLQNIYAAQQSIFFNWLDDMRTRLQKQIGYYFSSGNLETDIFLKRNMDSNGWVPITLIAGFRRIEALMKEARLVYKNLGSLNFMPDHIPPLTSDEQFISDSLRCSNDVEVKGDKIRKRHEWKKWVSPQNPT